MGQSWTFVWSGDIFLYSITLLIMPTINIINTKTKVEPWEFVTYLGETYYPQGRGKRRKLKSVTGEVYSGDILAIFPKGIRLTMHNGIDYRIRQIPLSWSAHNEYDANVPTLHTDDPSLLHDRSIVRMKSIEDISHLPSGVIHTIPQHWIDYLFDHLRIQITTRWGRTHWRSSKHPYFFVLIHDDHDQDNIRYTMYPRWKKYGIKKEFELASKLRVYTFLGSKLEIMSRYLHYHMTPETNISIDL